MLEPYFIHNKAVELCKLVLRMTTSAGTGHASSCMSIAHIVVALMYRIMRYDLHDPWNIQNDRLVLSEGHAVPIVYAAYGDLKGVYGDSPKNKKSLTIDDLDRLRSISSVLDGHPNPSAGFPFFDFATGSLGQGLSDACGLALAARMEFLDRHLFVIIGDGESREGQIWEACDFLIDYNLVNVTPIFNCNGQGQTGAVSSQQSVPRLSEKLRAFGFKTFIIDGHNAPEVYQTLSRAKEQTIPCAVIARTVKGWGVKELENDFHGKALKQELLNDAFAQLDKKVIVPISSDNNQIPFTPSKPPLTGIPKTIPGKLHNPDFSYFLRDEKEALEKFQNGILSTRRAYGLALRELVQIDDRVVVLDGDVSNSTFSNYVAKSFPEKFIECKIAEQNMISVASGLAAGGKIPFVSTFAKFLTRGYDQFELSLIGNLPLKLCGSHSGANIAADGPSQMGLCDMSYMRGLSTAKNKQQLPLVTIFNPSCAVCAYKCIQCMTDLQGACYIRTLRADLPVIYKPDEEFEPGGAKILKTGNDLAIFTTGFMVHLCLKQAQKLKEKGIDAAVIDCYSLPLNPGIVTAIARSAAGKIITVEDTFGNSLGAEIASIISADPEICTSVKQKHLSRIPKSALTAQEVLDFSGLDMDNW